MTTIQFGRLEDLPLREAWSHEAHQFTPWLAENIDHLSDVIGIPLELTGTEVSVETFSADILARNPEDGARVLIENQLEKTDHTHLGQIMTYLAGLEAKIVVWVAPDFREPHLTAIRWLNEHTADGFSFFAIRLRVVRIGDSPFAPIFEIVEKPDEFERSIRQKVESEGAAYYDIKEEFWGAFLAAHPETASLGVKSTRYSANYITICKVPNIDIAIWIGRDQCGIYVRSGHSEPCEPVEAALSPQREMLETCLGAPLGPNGRGNHFLGQKLHLGHDVRDDWPAMIDWLDAKLDIYRTALTGVLGEKA